MSDYSLGRARLERLPLRSSVMADASTSRDERVTADLKNIMLIIVYVFGWNVICCRRVEERLWVNDVAVSDKRIVM